MSENKEPMNIKVGYLISYDFEYIKISLPRVYDFVSEIFFAVDIERKTWSGKDFTIAEDFWKWVKKIDVANKITIYEDSFFCPELSAMECDTRERNMLGKKMGACDWYIQIDSDEYFIDFEGFVTRLKAFKPKLPTTVYCRVATLFKQVSSGYLLIDDSIETLSFATNNPVYNLARNNTSGNEQIYWDDLVLHQSWARSAEEIYLKLNNWSHKDDLNTSSFYKLWDAIDEFNYYCLSNFHPIYPVTWPKLKLIQGNITQILDSAETWIIKPLKPVKKNFLSRLWKKIKA